MKEILISIKPKYVAKILNGEKTIEIRKTFPKCELPINVYVYCTKENANYYIKNKIYNSMINGKVVAKFTLNRVEPIKYHFGCYDMGEWTESYILESSCLNSIELDEYLKASQEYNEKKPSRVYGYAWHIDNLEVFDTPRGLQPYFDLDKAPQSWRYLEKTIVFPYLR